MNKKTLANVAFISAVSVLAVALAVRFYRNYSENEQSDRSLSECAAMMNGSLVEGLHWQDLAPDLQSTSRRSAGRNTQPRFLLLVSDSSCTPCLANHIKSFLTVLLDSGQFVPEEWCCLFWGKKETEALQLFQAMVGTTARFERVTMKNESLRMGEASYVCFLTDDGTILAASPVVASRGMVQHFTQRLLNYLSRRKTASHTPNK
jgi:hypothetical protein